MYNRFKGIIISGLPVSGKTTLIKELSKIYKHWPVFSIGEIWREKWEKTYPHGEKSFEDFWRELPIEDQRNINVKAKEFFGKGNIIADSRYSIYCKDLPLLLVFLIAELDIRAKRASSKYLNKPLHEIRTILIKRENDEIEIGRMIFGKEYDYRDPRHYHIVLNTGILTLSDEINIIRSVLNGGW